MNPEFFFCCFDLKIAQYLEFFNWLKNFHILGNDFIPVWEDYRFMLFCEHAWNSTPTELPTTQNPHNYRQMLFQVSPQLIRIFHAYKLLGQFTCDILYHIHLFFDLSWDELRSVICPLRGLIGEDKDRLGELFVFASDSTSLAEHDLDSTIHDLAWGGLHVATKMISGSIFTDG
ncbi:hypothetical protein B0H11DRAFT_393174 [Mycena galericulata]|nr:hypothetical protein B0H11DRAFT_393174 [Mycena galericulata]